MPNKIALALAWGALAAVAFAQHRPQNDSLPLVKADFPLCVTIKPGPIRPQRTINGRAPVSELS